MAPNLVRSQNQYNCTNVSHDGTGRRRIGLTDFEDYYCEIRDDPPILDHTRPFLTFLHSRDASDRRSLCQTVDKFLLGVRFRIYHVRGVNISSATTVNAAAKQAFRFGPSWWVKRSTTYKNGSRTVAKRVRN